MPGLNTPIDSPIADNSAVGQAVSGLRLNPDFGPSGDASGGDTGPLQLNPMFGPTATPQAAPVQQPEQGDFMRGASTAVDQTKQMYYGAKALIGDAVGSDSMRDENIQRYNEIGDEIQKNSKPSDSFTDAWKSGDMIDFLQYGAGYVGAQAGMALASGGVGSLVGKMMARGALKKGMEALVAGQIKKKVAEAAAKGVAEDVARDAAVRSVFSKLGSGSALAGFNLSQEAGQIYPDALKEAQAKGQDVDLLKVFGSAALAAGLETAADAFNIGKLGKVMGGAEKGGSSLLRNVAVESFKGGMREGLTELAQTGVERFGAGQSLTSPEAIRDYVDSTALGVLGGGGFGAVAGSLESRGKAAPGPVAAPGATSPTTDTGTASSPANAVPDSAFVPARQIEVTDDLRKKFAPDLEARGVDPLSDQGTAMIQRLEQVEQATGVIRARQAQEERGARQEEVKAAFGDTATSGIGTGVMGAEPIVRRDSVTPNDQTRTLQPVENNAEPVTLPETSWNTDPATTTHAIAPEDVVARQQDWEAPGSFDVKTPAGEPNTVANRFVTEAAAAHFVKAYAPKTADTQFQIRSARRAKSEGGGTYHFIEERPLPHPKAELVVGYGTRDELTKAKNVPAAVDAAAPDAGAGSAPGAQDQGLPSGGSEVRGGGANPVDSSAGSQPVERSKQAPGALTRNLGNKRVVFPDANHVETFNHGRVVNQLPVAQAQLRQLEQDQAKKATKKRAAEIEEQRTKVQGLEKKAATGRARVRSAVGNKALTNQEADQRAVAYHAQVRDAAKAHTGEQPMAAPPVSEPAAKPAPGNTEPAANNATQAPVSEPTPAQAEPVAEPAKAAENVDHGPEAPDGRPYANDVRDALSRIQGEMRDRGAKGLVLDLAPVPAGTRGEHFRAAAEIVRRLFGKQLVVVSQSKPTFQGLHAPYAPGLIFISEDTHRPVMAVIGHEMLHALRTDRPDVFNKLARELRVSDYDGFKADIDRLYAEHGLDSLGDDKAAEELVADISGDFWTDPDFWATLGRRNPTLFGRVAKFVQDFLNHIHSALSGHFRPFGSERYLENIDQARDAIARAMQEYSEGVQPTEGVEPAEESSSLSLDDLGRRDEHSTASAAGAGSSDVGHRREASTGRYVGAPNWVGNSPQRLAAMRANLRKLALEGEPGRMWYENSSKAILQLAGGDKVEAEKIAGLIAIYSPNASVPANTAMALNAYFQYKAGVPIKAGMARANRYAEDLLRHEKAWHGIKTNSFYQNLMVEIDPSKLEKGVATMDMWMALAFDYGKVQLDQGPTYTFAERETQRLADELGWTAHQTQAAIWTAIKARVEASAKPRKAYELKHGIAQLVTKADEVGKESTSHTVVKGREYDHYRAATKFGMQHELTREEIDNAKQDFADAIKARTVQMSWEATPGRTSGVLPGIHEAPIEQKFEYLVAVEKALMADGKDAIAEAVGLPGGVSVNGFSAWEGDIGAGAQTFVGASVGGAGKSRGLKPEARQLLDLYAAAKGLVLHQMAVVYHLPIFDEAASRKNGAQITTERALNEDEMRHLHQALHDHFGTWELAPADRPDGVRILNFVDGLDNKKFQAGIDRIISELPDEFGGKIIEHSGFRSDGNYISNDWEQHPNGEEYAQRLSTGRPDLQGRVADLRARVAAVNQDFSARYGWGNPGPSAASLRSQAGEVSLSPVPIERPGWDERTKRALNEPFTPAPKATIRQRLEAQRPQFLKRVISALVDPFVGLKEIDDKLYMRARLSNGTDGGLEALMHFGQVYDHDGALDVKKGTTGLIDALKPLGNEVEDFFRWVALNRAAQLKKQDRENFFTDESIALRGKFVEGKMADGKARQVVYQKALADMNALNRSVLDLAKKQGLIDQAGYNRFSNDIWYVPFYRVIEENDNAVTSVQAASGLSGQKFGERLKGGTDRVGDLLPNVLRNWGSILAASQKNGVARDALAQAEQMGAAEQVQAGTAGAARVMVDGREKSYSISDPLVANAILSINMAALNHPVLKVMNAFKKALTFGVTLAPDFKIRNLLRDSIQSMALGDLPYNPIANVAGGLAGLRGDLKASVLAGGGLFGHQMDEHDLEERIKRLAEKGMDERTILRSPEAVIKALRSGGAKGLAKAAFESYDALGQSLENANRAALYNSMIGEGKSHLEAAFAARDLMDFSLQGHNAAVRMLSMVLPFFNARLQGLYKIGRDGVAPTLLTIMGKANEGERAKAARFTAVTGAVVMAGLALYLAYKDDKDFQAREQWDRDNFWWFKAGGVAYRIPKPFELGAIGTIAERGLEQFIDPKVDGDVFERSMSNMFTNTFAFDPVPQSFRPLLNLIGNQDSFTQRPIETMGMQNLSKTERYSQGTSETAKLLSRANQAVASSLGTIGEGEVLSPAQIDYLARGYFGWLGAAVMQGTGEIAKWGSPVTAPSARIQDYPVIGSFVRDMPSDQSRYVSDFYRSATEIQQLYSDLKFYQKLGQIDKARELIAEHGTELRLHGLYSTATREIGGLNQQLRRVEASTQLTPDRKRELIDSLSMRKAMLAQRVEVMRRSSR